MHQQELGLCKRVLGKEHPDTLTSISNLAIALDNQGKYSEAEEIHRRTLKLRESVLRKEHLDMLTSIGSLARVLCG